MSYSVRMTLALLICSLPLAAQSSEYMLFAPRPLEGEVLLPERGKGVLVKRITLKKGDTLSQLSLDFSGKGSYFPQILLFNDIVDPDRIRAGNDLLVPVSKQAAIADTPAPPVKKAQSGAKKPKPKPAQIKAAVPVQKSKPRIAVGTPTKKSAPVAQQAGTRTQNTYPQAITAYRAGDYQEALELFSRFLEQYPASPLAADAALYKAECLFKLSGQ